MSTTCQSYAVGKSIPCILIIDDDTDDQILLKIAFEHITENLSLHFVSTAQEALEYLQLVQDPELPHLIVADYHLPRDNGYKLIQQLNGITRFQGITKVILSNFLLFPGLEHNKIEAGQCFMKPDSFDQMKHLAEQLLQLCPGNGHIYTEPISS